MREYYENGIGEIVKDATENQLIFIYTFLNELFGSSKVTKEVA